MVVNGFKSNILPHPLGMLSTLNEAACIKMSLYIIIKWIKSYCNCYCFNCFSYIYPKGLRVGFLFLRKALKEFCQHLHTRLFTSASVWERSMPLRHAGVWFSPAPKAFPCTELPAKKGECFNQKEITESSTKIFCLSWESLGSRYTFSSLLIFSLSNSSVRWLSLPLPQRNPAFSWELGTHQIMSVWECV